MYYVLLYYIAARYGFTIRYDFYWFIVYSLTYILLYSLCIDVL